MQSTMKNSKGNVQLRFISWCLNDRFDNKVCTVNTFECNVEYLSRVLSLIYYF